MATRSTSPKPDDVFITPEEHARALAEQQQRMILSANDDGDDTPEDRVKRVLADLRDDARAVVKLYRRGAANKIFWCDDFPLSDFDSGGFQLIRERFGPGEYQIRVYGNGGVKTKADINIMANTLSSAPIPPIGQSSGMDAVLSALQTQNQLFMEFFQRQNPAPAPAINPMDQMTQMLTVMKLMKEATAAPPAPAPSPIGEIVAAMRELRGAAKELMPGEAEEKEPSMMQLAGQVVPLLQSALSQRGSAPPMIPDSAPLPQISIPESIASAAPNPIEQPATQPQENPQPEEQDESEMNALQKIKLAALLGKLAQMATENKPHQDGADLILDKAPDEVIEFLDTPGWWEALSASVPQVVPHKDWLHGVHALVIKSLDEEDDAKA